MSDIILVAGESSGDLLGAHLANEIKNSFPHLRLFGIGGERMKAAGVKCFAESSELSVMGYWDVLLRATKILSLRRNLLNEISRRRPSLFIGIDAPDFNLNIAKCARKMGIKTVQYGSPSVWMWRRNRVEKISQAVDEVWCLFPFETKIYDQNDVCARFVGHPAALMAPSDKKEARRHLNLPEKAQIIALLPGSRPAELHIHLPLLAQTIKLMNAPERIFVAAATDDNTATLIRQKIPAAIVKTGVTPTLLAAADVALLKSGTSALEAAFTQTPMVVFYRTSWVSLQALRWRKFYLPFFCLPNILCGRFIVPELLNNEATSQALATATLRLLTDKTKRDTMSAALAQIRPPLAVSGALPAALEELLSCP